jgi:hypothetical protein
MTEQELNRRRLHNLLRHISNVQREAILLSERLMDNGEFGFSKQLLARSLQHDASKFFGIEWEYLHGDVKEDQPETFLLAAKQHVDTNQHHPEYWQDIQHMPRICIAEMVCDWKSRSDEFGNDIRDWIKEQATKKYGFSLHGVVYKTIKEFVDILLDPPFKG